ncbi:hypothetical protein QBC39DRAFT_161229 [Podospora conica]|nr:hypothetical protein QBC39DRAFT_161229 [Schizothecium conicum]
MTTVTQSSPSTTLLTRHDPSSKTRPETPRHLPPSYTSPSLCTTDNRAAVAAHSGRLRYANARDLPSFPSSGLRDDDTAAASAASIGWTTHPPKPWARELSTTASTAAVFANDSQMPPPEPRTRRSAAGSQAAVRAAGDAAQRNQPSQPSPPSQWGNSAANLAFRASMPPPAVTSDSPSLDRQGSLRAAKGAMAARPRPRAASSPILYPDQANAASNALSAATIAHRPSPSPKAAVHPVGGSVPFTVMDRKMYTSNPPVKPELDERQRNDTIHASAVAMAKQMYSRQQTTINTTNANALARSSSFERHGKSTGATKEQPMVFDNLHEAAYRRAQERLAKLQEDHDRGRGFQDYYGSSVPQRSNKLGSFRNKLTRRRSASDGVLLEDKKKSMQIRKQMTLFDSKLAEVDEKKRLRDREALLATAHRNVQARLKDMDDKIQEETGWVQPSKRDDWEWKARVAAQARFDASRAEQERKVDLGGGKVMDKEAVEAIAAQRVQPLLDEINEKAELERERKMAEKAEEERKRMEEERDRVREKEIQEIHKQLKEQQKEQDKLRREELRKEERETKELERQARAEQKRAAKEGKQKGKEVIPPLSLNDPIAEKPTEKQPEPEAEESAGKARTRVLSVNFKRHSKSKSTDSIGKKPSKNSLSDSIDKVSGQGGKSNSSPQKLKNWFKNLARPRSNSSPDGATREQAEVPQKGFIGGATLAKLAAKGDNTLAVNEGASASMREVALAGRNDESEVRGESSKTNPSPTGNQTPSLNPRADRDGDSVSLSTRSVSSMSSSLDEFEEARTTLNSPIASPITPPPRNHLRIGTEVEASPVKGSRFSEILE